MGIAKEQQLLHVLIHMLNELSDMEYDWDEIIDGKYYISLDRIKELVAYIKKYSPVCK